jgi:folylpolyglutamate synthase
MTSRESPIRVFIFNCTHGRSGASFLETVLAKIATQLQLHGSREDPHTFFDKVIFCTNVTYADGHFKGGKIESFLAMGSCAADTWHFLQT